MTGIHILYEFTDGPWGGGNQFLKALRSILRKKGAYCESPEHAETIVFNSHHNLEKVGELRRQSNQAIFIHRVDGPVFRVRGNSEEVDAEIYTANEKYADGTVFQSEWSRNANYEEGMRNSGFSRIIINAPDPDMFYRAVARRRHGKRKLRLIATSWSGNMRKGFDVYRWLDSNLDFSNVDMTFVGNSPVEFQNIRHLAPLPSYDLAEVLRTHDIYIQASSNEPCSNALIEALHCGLPAIARNHGGNPEIVRSAGELFSEVHEIPPLVDRIARDIDGYCQRIALPHIEEVGDQYCDFISDIVDARDRGQYVPKHPPGERVRESAR